MKIVVCNVCSVPRYTSPNTTTSQRRTGHQRWPLFPTSVLFQNFWIWIRARKFFEFENPTPVQIPTAVDATAIQHCFYLRNDIYKYHADSCYCRTGFSKFLTPQRRILPKSTPALRIRGHFCWPCTLRSEILVSTYLHAISYTPVISKTSSWEMPSSPFSLCAVCRNVIDFRKSPSEQIIKLFNAWKIGNLSQTQQFLPHTRHSHIVLLNKMHDTRVWYLWVEQTSNLILCI